MAEEIVRPVLEMLQHDDAQSSATIRRMVASLLDPSGQMGRVDASTQKAALTSLIDALEARIVTFEEQVTEHTPADE